MYSCQNYLKCNLQYINKQLKYVRNYIFYHVKFVLKVFKKLKFYVILI